MEPIADPEELRSTRLLAWRVLAYSLVTAVLATGLFAVASVPVS